MNDEPELSSALGPTGISRRRLIQLGAAGAAGLVLAGGRAATTSASTSGSGPGVPLEKLRLGFGYIGPINDNGWTQEHHRGRQAVFDALGDKVEGSYVENITFDPALTTPIFEDLAQHHDCLLYTSDAADE